MSLDWNAKCCKDKSLTGWIKDENGKEHIHPATNTLVWGAMIGTFLTVVSEKTYTEWLWRIEFLRAIDWPWMQDGRFPTEDEVFNHIGLSTNAFPAKSRKAFTTHYMKRVGERATEEVAKMYTLEDKLSTLSEADQTSVDLPAVARSVG